VTGVQTCALPISNIVFDFNAQFGDESLARALREHLNDRLRDNAGLLKFMAEDDAQGRAPINWFNNSSMFSPTVFQKFLATENY